MNACPRPWNIARAPAGRRPLISGATRFTRSFMDVRREVLGRSTRRRAIEAFVGREGHGSAIIFGGFHGDEPKSVSLARTLVDRLSSKAAGPADGGWVVVPLVNPDGYAARRRRNARSVDINRNFPTSDFSVGDRRSRMFGGDSPASEPETRAVMRAIERFEPDRIVTIHSINQGRFCNNFDGPGKRLAAAMARLNGYPARASIGYPTPGSFGRWAGVERRIAVITLELPSHHSLKRCWEDNHDALVCAVRGRA